MIMNVTRRQSSEAPQCPSYIGGGEKSEMVPQECARPPSYSPRNQRHNSSSGLRRPESSAEEINIKDPPKASQERPNPPFSPHPELFSGKEMEGGVTRARAGAVSSCDKVSGQPGGKESTGRWSQEATGHGDDWKPCTDTSGNMPAVLRIQLPSTAAVTKPEKQANEDSTIGGLAGLKWKDRGEGEPSIESRGKRLPGTILTHQDFGLRNWKEYAALRQVACLSLLCPFYASAPGSGAQSPAHN